MMWLFGLGWVVSLMGFGAWRRRRLGLAVFRPAFPGSLVDEDWRSGGRGLFGANNCAWISLLPGRLVTGMHFPFNLAFPRVLMRWAGLDNDIRLTEIVAVDDETFLMRRRLRITYRTPSGESSFWLDLRRPDKLREAIAAARQRA